MIVGDRVYAMSDGYGGTGTIIKFESNLFGRLLVIVALDNGCRDSCFYRWEVSLISDK